MTQSEAISYLIGDFSLSEMRELNDDMPHCHAPDILYYADAFGCLEMAFVLQGFDKKLPDIIHKALYKEYKNDGLDVLEMVNTHEIQSSVCPVCSMEIFTFEFPRHHTEYMTEYGNVLDVTFLEDETQPHYFPEAEETGQDKMCQGCRDVFPWVGDENGGVRIHLPDVDEISGFSVQSGVIQHRDFGYMNRRSAWVPLPDMNHTDDFVEFSREHAASQQRGRGWLAENYWSELSHEDFMGENCAYGDDVRFRDEFRDVIRQWARSNEETHPDLEYPYIMIDGKYLFYKEGGRNEVYDAMASQLEQAGLTPAEN